MILTWLPFALMFYVIEPLFLHRLMQQTQPEDRFEWMSRAHYLLLGLLLVKIIERNRTGNLNWIGWYAKATGFASIVSGVKTPCLINQ